MKKKQQPSKSNKSIAAMAVLLAHFSAHAAHEKPQPVRGEYQVHASTTKVLTPVAKRRLDNGVLEHNVHLPPAYIDMILDRL